MQRDAATGYLAGLRRLAKGAADVLATDDRVLGLALLGSVARGDASVDSDVDLLVVTRRAIRSSMLRESVPTEFRSERLSLLALSGRQWGAEADRGSLFLHHVRLEGRLVYDPHGVLAVGLERVAERPPDIDGELERQLHRLRVYRDTRRLNGQCLFALSHLYAIGKATAIARCIEFGDPIFIKQSALENVARHRPLVAASAEFISTLRPFYDLTRGRDPGPLPFAATEAEDKVARAVTAIHDLARA